MLIHNNLMSRLKPKLETFVWALPHSNETKESQTIKPKANWYSSS